MRKIIFILFTLLLLQNSFAQNKYYSHKKKAVKKFESALHNYNLQYYAQARQELSEALKIDKNFLDVYILLAEINDEEGKKEEAVINFEKALAINKKYHPLIYLRKADLELQTGQYQAAIKDYESFLEFKKESKKYLDYINTRIGHCKFAIEEIKNKVPFDPINLGPHINSPHSEYWPSLTADNQTITFTVSDRKKHTPEDLYYSKKAKDKWLPAKNIGQPINTQKSEGAQSVSADGRTMVFTACLRKDGYGSCDIYIAHKTGNNWSKPKNIGQPINSRYKETQPSLSSDGQSIYFVSTRPGGKGKFDIWQSHLQKNGQWSVPENLGDSINTKEDELAPFIHYDNKTLYFSSNGHVGMGGSDLFVSRINKNGEWSSPKNLGYPINTYFNEESLIVTADGTQALFSSDMDGGYGQKDIYSFALYKEIRPNKTIFVKGLVYHAVSKKPLEAQVTISSLVGSGLFGTKSDKENGSFLLCLPPQKSYALNIDKEGFLPYSDNFELPDSNIVLTIYLQPIEKDKVFVLKNIFFDTDKYKLKTKSYIELDRLIDFLNKNKKLKIEIQGHTDNTGSKTHNQILSENRAKSVYNYLIKNNMDKKRLTFKGYAATQAIADNNTKRGRAKNRRTAFKIISTD
jgi:outer membrane protein OmpA-like peptidoglycan-associated protein